MCKRGLSVAGKGQFQAMVLANKAIGRRFYRLSLELSGKAAEFFAAAGPGQFAQLDASGLSLPEPTSICEDLRDVSQRQILLRRPFSFCDVVAKGKTKTCIEILYCVVGPATLRMTTLACDDRLSIIGPLGNGFSIPEGKKLALLVAGGMGAPPLQHLAKVLATGHCGVETLAFAGAKTIMDLPFELSSQQIFAGAGLWLGEFARYGIKSIIATEDGSAGYAGLITECLSQWLDKNTVSASETIIYTCGPEAMMAEVAKIAQAHNIDCQVSLERMMACGIGLCQSCAVECRQEGSDETVYKLCCKDGPVFDSKDVVWNRK